MLAQSEMEDEMPDQNDGNQDDQNDGDQNESDQNDGDQNDGDQEGDETPPTWETALAEMPEDVQALYADHTTGLRSALSSERKDRKSLSKQLRDVTAQLDKDSEAATALEKVTAQLDEAERRADFVEDAVKENVRNPRLAWMAANGDEDAFGARGRVNWDYLKEQYPELFAVETTTKSNAGAGVKNRNNQTPRDMNRIIRRAAGRVS